jgi:hypothetical protein
MVACDIFHKQTVASISIIANNVKGKAEKTGCNSVRYGIMASKYVGFLRSPGIVKMTKTMAIL